MRCWLAAVVAASAFMCGCGERETTVPLPADTARSHVSVDRSDGVLADGIDFATITIAVVDTSGAPLVGAAVHLDATGSGVVVTQPSPTDEHGVSVGFLSSTVAGAKSLSATVSSPGAVRTLDDTPTVAFVDRSTMTWPTQLAFVTPPALAMAKAPIVPVVQVAIEDAAGNVLTAFDNYEISIALAGTPAGGTLSGTINASPVAGIAAFPGLSIDKAGHGYQLVATGGGFTVTSSPFDVVTGPPVTTRSSLVATPSLLAADGVRHSTLRLTIEDAGGNPVPGQTVTWSVSGAGNTLVAASVTDASGICDATLASTMAERKLVTATAGALTLQATVTFTTAAPGCFFPSVPMLETRWFPQAVAAADFNGDGKVDLAVVAHGYPSESVPGGVGMFLGNGDGTFAARIDSPVGGDGNVADDAVSGDFNHDGKRDLAIIGDAASILLGNGDGTFAAPVIYDVGMYPWRLVAADFDADGNLDLAIATNTDVAVLFGNSDGTFRAAVHFASPHPVAIAAGDFDGDGAIDLAVANGYDDYMVVWLRGDGHGAFAAPANVAMVPNASAIAAADLDGDGKLDLAVTEGTDTMSKLVPLMGRGDGTFTVGNAYDAGNGSIWLTVRDFNRDGHLDVITVGNNVLLGNGDGTFGAPISIESGDATMTIASDDFNGDGNPDVALVSNRDTDVSVLLGDGGGAFAGAQRWPVAQPESVITGDFDGDGRADVVTMDGDSSVAVLLNQGNLELAPPRYCNGLHGFGRALAAGDFNGDGKLDVALRTSGDNLELLPGNGDGTFGTSIVSAGDDYASALAVADLDHDGKLDLVSAAYNNRVLVSRGNGDGTFAAPATYFLAKDSLPTSAQIGDFDRDGKLDVAVIENGTGTVDVFHGNGDGTLGAVVTTYAGTTGQMAAADFDGDGKLDLAIGVDGDPFVVILVGNGNRTFKAASFASWGGSKTPAVSALVAVDIDGDGKIDLATANGATSNLTLLRGFVAGAFTVRATYWSGGEPYGLAAADLDGDGRIELISANHASGNVSIFRGGCSP